MDFEAIKNGSKEDFEKFVSNISDKAFKVGLSKAKETAEANEKLKEFDKVQAELNEYKQKDEFNTTVNKINAVADEVGLKRSGINRFVKEFGSDIRKLDRDKLKTHIKKMNNEENSLYFDQSEVKASSLFNNPVQGETKQDYASTHFAGTTLRQPKRAGIFDK